MKSELFVFAFALLLSSEAVYAQDRVFKITGDGDAVAPAGVFSKCGKAERYAIKRAKQKALGMCNHLAYECEITKSYINFTQVVKRGSLENGYWYQCHAFATAVAEGNR